MRYNRCIPFGYHVVDGILCACPSEAETIKTIFADYISGDSYKTIADRLEGGHIPYNSKGGVWNKNTVKRIIENPKYTGAGPCPPIIEREQYEAARTIQASKTQNYRPIPKTVCLVRKRMECAQCGQPYYRDTRTKAKDYWICTNPACGAKDRLGEIELFHAIASKLNQLIQQPDFVEVPDIHIQQNSIELGRLTNDLMRQMEGVSIDAADLRDVIKSLASEKYRICDDGQAAKQASALRSLLEKTEPSESLNHTLFDMLVGKVLISAEGDVFLRLVTGQVFVSADG